MQKIDLKVGDKAWIHGILKNGNKTEGKVIAILDLPGYSFQHYVIEILTPVDPLLEIRDPWSVSDAEDKPVGLWRRS